MLYALSILMTVAKASWCADCWCATNGRMDCPQRPTNYTTDFANQLLSQKPLNSYTMACNPYKEENCMQPPPPDVYDPDAVCAYKFADDDCDEYSMLNYPSREAAEADGAFVTHFGNCGACSSAQDLSVYIKYFDMTTPARHCAMLNLLSEDMMLKCYADMGMTADCGRMWGYNSANTRDHCLGTCLLQYFEDQIGIGGNNGPAPECKINDCLECDEVKSGPNFSKFAGRTRRNTGLESGITRPCQLNKHLEHKVCPMQQVESQDLLQDDKVAKESKTFFVEN